MKNHLQIPSNCVSRTVRWLAFATATMIALPALAQLTDLANAPLTNGGSVPVKPNIMLMLDTSNSMRRTHMPDELETTAPALSLGYKSYQCNILFYNRTQVYQLPRNADGTQYPMPSFTSARYNGFDSASALINLSTAFQAFDNSTRQNAVGADTPQAAYYYLHSSGQSFTPNAAPCTDVDTNVSKAATVSPSGVMGNWTRVLVGASSGPGMTDETQNFAIWYSYYRTRINLAKSAISLAFTPLTDSYRVGFITVLPNVDLAGSGAVDSAYYLPISDFNTSQRNAWFNKVFSQNPRGSSPTRQGLARVGRHFAGMTNGINQGMPEDPIQYSCQQNFLIATTDGYWNAGAETVGAVQTDGTTLVGQQDGTLTLASGNSPRPIWDGTNDNTRIVTDKNNLYSYAPCIGTWQNRSTLRVDRSTSQTQRSTSQILQSTTQNRQTSVQNFYTDTQYRQATTQITQSTNQPRQTSTQVTRATSQNLANTLQNQRSTLQNLVSTQRILRSSAQVVQSTVQTVQRQTRRMQRIDRIQETSSQVQQTLTQTVQNTTQNLRTSVQNLESRTQNLRTDVQITQTIAQTTQSTLQNLRSTVQNRTTSFQNAQSTVQNLQSTSQVNRSTLQNLTSTSQNRKTETQVRQDTLQILSCSSITEVCTPVATCTAGGVITCQNVTTGPTLVASCTAAMPNSGNNFVRTNCVPTVVGPTPVATCTPSSPVSPNFITTTCDVATTGPTPSATCSPITATSPNWVTTTCSTSTTGPTPVSSCTVRSAASTNNPDTGTPWTSTSCNTATTGPTPVASCTASGATSPNWITTTCSNNNTTNVGVQTCTPSTATSPNWTTVTCSNPAATNYTAQPSPPCVAQTGNAGNQWITLSCPGALTTTNVPVQTCSNQTAGAGNAWTQITCSTSTTGPTGVNTCTPITATMGNSWVTTSCGNGNSGPTGVMSCTPQTRGPGNQWIERTCGNNNVTNLAVASCSSISPTAMNGYLTRTCSNTNYTNTPRQTCTPQTGSAMNSWVTLTCANTGANNYANTPVLTCSPQTAAVGNNWVTLTCPTPITATNQPVSACTPVPMPSGPNFIYVTCPAPIVTGPTFVASCSPQAAASGNAWTQRTCTNPAPTNYANTPVAACTPQTAAMGNNWRTISCASVVVQPPTAINPASCAVGNTLGGGPNFNSTQCYDEVIDVPAATCTPQTAAMANGWVTITCPPPVTTTSVPVQTCTPAAATMANGFTATTCSNPPATNFTSQPAMDTFAPQPSTTCTPQTANAGNNWITISCPTPITTTNVPAASCTPSASSASVNPNTGLPWSSTTCSTATSGPTPWDPALCPLGPGRTSQTTGGSLSPFIYQTCAPNDANNVPVQTCAVGPATSGNSWTQTTACSVNATGPTPVQTCTNRTAAITANPDTGTIWTSSTCAFPPANNYTNQPVSSCTAQTAAMGNNWITLSCNPAVTTNVGVPACTASGPTMANNWVTTTCGTNNSPSVNINAPCVPSGPTMANSWVTTTCPAPTVTGPIAIQTCTPVPVGSPVRVCSNTGMNNYTNQPVASCTPQTATALNNWVAITCPAPVTTSMVPVASCSPATANSGNSFTTTTCNTATSGPTGVAPGTCMAASANSGNMFIQTTCNIATTGPTPVASCTAAMPTSGNLFVATTCNSVTTGPTLTQTCTNTPASMANSFTSVSCTPAAAQKVQSATTTTVTSTPYSGGYPTAAPTITTTTAAAADVDTACYTAGVESLPALPNPGKPGTPWVNGLNNTITLQPAPTSPCVAWPCVANTNTTAGGVANSLADVAQYYYVTDLRPAMENNVPATGSGPEDDRATHQHMTTFTIGLGVSGILRYRPDYRSLSTTTGDFAEIRSGIDPPNRQWPFPDADQPGSIDDFWHAAVNGRGQYFSAGDPTTVVNGLASALAGVTARTGSGSAAAPSSQAPSDGDNLTYIASYVTQKWSGEVEAREIDLNTGGPKNTVVWSAKAKLDAKARNACDNRNINLFRSGATNNMVPFTWNTRVCDSSGNPTGASLTSTNATEQANFAAANVAVLSQYPSMTDGTSGTADQRTPAAGANLLNYIRGQRGFEDFTANNASKLYRKRDTILGDITNSAPRYVRGATADYLENNYDVFASSSASRIPMVYVASNGGMLHAFRAGTGVADTAGGNEEWAFIPTQVLPNLYKIADNNYANTHVYSVDGTPVPSDIYDSVAGQWKKILVAGLNGGGKGYYALDVTNPLAPKAMWEFNWSNTCYDGTSATAGADCHLGFTYGKPIYGKLTNGTWVVMVSSGHNNVNSPTKVGDGIGYLYVLNAATGKIIYKMSTGVGSATSPSGLTQLALYADDPTVSLLALQVYGVDLKGNIWRFDVNDQIAPAGREVALVATVKAPDGTPQPITTTPRLLEVDNKPFIIVGTGKLLGTTDLSDNQVQTLYGFADNTSAPVTNLRTTLAPLAFTQTGSDTSATGTRTIACTGSVAECGITAGWYVDLPSTGERLVVDPRVELGTLQVATSILSASACNVGGIGKLISLNAVTGLALPGTTPSRGYLTSLPVGITVLKLPGGAIVSVVADATGANIPFPFPVDTPGPKGKRVTWRELTQ
jgi:Tfp pilus tip-associated adhesin PilY1